MIRLDAAFIRQVAKKKLPFSLSLILLKQAWYELRFKLRKHLSFRKRINREATAAYALMEPGEFEWINARQQWANWRTIPKMLSGKFPNEPITAVDLCCGTGHSTQVLAYYLPRRSRIIGLEFSPVFVSAARRRRYLDRSGAIAHVSFRAQSVLEAFRDAEGRVIGSGTVDLVNSSGAVGCHFTEPDTVLLAAEVFRVLRPGGIASIDSGAAGTSMAALIRIFESFGFVALDVHKSCLLDPYRQVSLRKPELFGVQAGLTRCLADPPGAPAAPSLFS
jgi:SAM-dependent methyltransferase